MKSIALLARKGGTGKSTVAIHMGVLAEASGRKVLFCDLDPQRSLTAWWKSRTADTPILIEADVRQLGELSFGVRQQCCIRSLGEVGVRKVMVTCAFVPQRPIDENEVGSRTVVCDPARRGHADEQLAA